MSTTAVMTERLKRRMRAGAAGIEAIAPGLGEMAIAGKKIHAGMDGDHCLYMLGDVSWNKRSGGIRMQDCVRRHYRAPYPFKYALWHGELKAVAEFWFDETTPGACIRAAAKPGLEWGMSARRRVAPHVPPAGGAAPSAVRSGKY